MSRLWGPTLIATVSVLTLTACSLPTTGSARSGSASSGSAGAIDVVTAMYPLEYLAEQIGGEAVTVRNLTPAGAEAHDLELAPADVFTMEASHLVLTLGGFAPAVDTALTELPDLRALDVGPHVDLLPVTDRLDDDGHGDDGDDDEHDHPPGSLDPHFWLDPERMVLAANLVGAELIDLDPASRPAIEANLDRFLGDLTAIDESYREGLEHCQSRAIFTSHAAFGYLANRYDLTEVAIAGISPEVETSPARLAEIRTQVLAHGVHTLLTEPLASAKTAQTLADELGIEVAVLDPIEGLAAPTSDYADAMTTNLTTLRTALDCS